MSGFRRHRTKCELQDGPSVSEAGSGPASPEASSGSKAQRGVVPVPDAKGSKHEKHWFFGFIAIGITVLIVLVFGQFDAGPSLAERAVAGLTACIALGLGVWVKGIRER